MLELKERNCVPIEDGARPLNNDQIAQYKLLLKLNWQLMTNKILKKEFVFESFIRAMAFVQEIALIAEKENHHPDICVHYTKVEIELSTHDVGGLSENDFIMAAKIENL
jgi:4a-hydroxytetrahydrobiopterin dehydratase